MSSHLPADSSSLLVLSAGTPTVIALTPLAEAEVEDLGKFSGASSHNLDVAAFGLVGEDDEEYSPPADDGPGAVTTAIVSPKRGVFPKGCLPVSLRCG